MTVQRLAPDPGVVDAAQLADELAGRGPVAPFADAVVDFCAGFARRLSKDPAARRFPELQALAFWMRRAELVRLEEQFAAATPAETVAVPRGLALHIPPANVDTIFIYSWLLSVLVGNRNIVRLSSRESEQTTVILAVLNEELAAHEGSPVAAGNAFVTYGHDQAITDALSARSDVRVIWGGDATIAAISASPLPPHARQITFADRTSLAVLSAGAVAGASEDELEALVHAFFNDGYWFDQAACSSPRSVVWIGDHEMSARASDRLFGALAKLVATRHYSVETATAMAKRLFLHQAAIDLPVTGSRWWSNEVVSVRVDDVTQRWTDHPGGGFFFEHRIDDIEDLAQAIGRRDQTLTHYGVERADLERLARRLGGAGIDRMVPVGAALAFDRFWDGYDLLTEFRRLVHIPTASGETVPA